MTVPFLEPFPNICVCSIQRKTRRHDQTGDTRESIIEILELGLGYYAFVCMAMPQNVIAAICSRYLRELAGWEYREYQHMIVREGFRRLVLLVSRTRPPVLQSSYK